MSLARTVAWRYLKRPADELISAVGIVSILGLVIGVMALVISMALMTGYRRDLQNKLLGGNAEIFVYGTGEGIANLDRTLRSIRAVNGVREAAPVLFQHALVSSETNTTGEQVMIKGIQSERSRSSAMLAKIIGPSGSFRTPDGSPGITVGKYLARKLGLTPGAAVTVTVPTRSEEGFLPRSANFVVTNVYDTGFFEFDARWMFLDLAEARRLAGSARGANLIEVKLRRGDADLDAAVKQIAAATGHRYSVTDWRQMNRQLFSLLKLQQVVLFIVIGLIVFVSTFNIVSTLIMTVHEKRREIGILISMGAEKRLIRRIFVWYGTLVGVAGTVAGLLLGAVICWILTEFKLVSFGPEIAEVYFVSSIPFLVQPEDLAVIAGFSVTVAFLATVIPSMRAARLDPVDALRHE